MRPTHCVRLAVAVCANAGNLKLALAAWLAMAAAASAATYPVSARLILAPKDSQQCLSRPAGPPDCSVVDEVHRAYQGVVGRMFETAAEPTFDLILKVEDASIFEQVNGGLALDILVRVSILSRDGHERVIDEIKSSGRVAVTTGSALADANARAAADAARDFEREYGRSEAVADYLIGNKAAPASAVAVEHRSDKLISAAGTFGFVQGSGDGDTVPVPGVRLAIQYGWFVVQGMYSSYSSSFQGARGVPPTHDATLTATDLGFEAGYVYRMGRSIELHAGPGVHFLSGDTALDAAVFDGRTQTTGPSSYSKISPTVFANASGVILPFKNGLRFLAGLEARAYLFTDVDARPLSRNLPVANVFFGAFLAVEFPYARTGAAR